MGSGKVQGGEELEVSFHIRQLWLQVTENPTQNGLEHIGNDLLTYQEVWRASNPEVASAAVRDPHLSVSPALALTWHSHNSRHPGLS